MKSGLNLGPTKPHGQTNQFAYPQISRQPSRQISRQTSRPISSERGSKSTSVIQASREDLLAILRGNVKERPSIDPNLSGGLRAWLEDEVIELANSRLDSSVPLIINTTEMIEAWIRSTDSNNSSGSSGSSGNCEPSYLASKSVFDFSSNPDCVLNETCAEEPMTGYQARLSSSRQPFSLYTAIGAIIHALFYQWINVGKIGDPLSDAIDALELTQAPYAHQKSDASASKNKRQQSLVEYIKQLPSDDLAYLRDEVTSQANIIRSQFPTLLPRWLPRTREQISLPLAGGRVILTSTIDLIIGLPATDTASTCVVNLRSGNAQPRHLLERQLAALFETVRSGSQPFRTATYYSSLGRIDANDVTEEMLAEAVQLIVPSLHGVQR